MGYRAKTGAPGEDKHRARRGGEKGRKGGASLSFFPYHELLAPLADFSFRPIPHLGACYTG